MRLEVSQRAPHQDSSIGRYDEEIYIRAGYVVIVSGIKRGVVRTGILQRESEKKSLAEGRTSSLLCPLARILKGQTQVPKSYIEAYVQLIIALSSTALRREANGTQDPLTSLSTCADGFRRHGASRRGVHGGLSSRKCF